jgi:hypothetical protein
LQMLGCGGGQASVNSDWLKLEIRHARSISPKNGSRVARSAVQRRQSIKGLVFCCICGR